MGSDEIYTIDELIRRRADELKDSTLIGYPKEALIDYEEHSARAIDKYADAAARALLQRGLCKVDGNLEKAPVVGILAHSGLHVIITLLALSRLGYAVLLLSTRLASPAISRLLRLSDCDTVLTTPNFHSVLAEVQKEQSLTLVQLLAHADYYGVDAPAITRTYNQSKETEKNAIIIHSSGSTGLPKPIWLTHKNCIAAFGTHLDMRALITSPLFHSQGFYETFRSIYSGKPIYYCNYALPLTKQSVTAMVNYVKPDLLHCVPYILKLLAESDEGIQCLARVKLVLYAGSACPDDLGDRLVRNGVYLVGNYGATETGRLMNSVRPPGDDAWNYMRMLPQVIKYVLMDEISPGIYECVALDGLKSKSTTNSDEPPGSFRTRDLFTQHPERPGLWKYVSRMDDRFTLVNGEKVLPIPMEGRIRQETFVKEAIVFGEGRSLPGVLVVKSDHQSHISDAEFLEMLWPAIQDANSRAESFSRIPKELVVILPPDTTYPQTDKGTFIRAPIYHMFKSRIDEAYAAFESNEGGTIAMSLPDMEEYLLRKVRDHLGVDLESPQADFFASGIDSLQCIKMWNLMKKELDLGGRQAQMSQNILYETGNISTLARYIEQLRTGISNHVANDEEKIMRNLITKYSSFDTFEPKGDRFPEKEVILLTGATGGLGAHLLAKLIKKSSVSEVWTLVRASTDTAALSRVENSLNSRGIQLEQSNGKKIVALASDLSKPDLGLGDTKFAELTSKLTTVIHSAWAVNFNISVQSFEQQHISAVHNLIKICLSAPFSRPARFFFCSSVSAAGATPRPGVVQEGPVDSVSRVQNTGYARSKYVSEHIVRNAMISSGIAARVLRVGQLIGDTEVGEWNPTEGIPLMIQTAKTLGALPALNEEMSWLPVDYAARVIVDLTSINDCTQEIFHDSDPDLVYHVLNPSYFHWTLDMLPALSKSGLKFEVVDTAKWMEMLRQSDRDPAKNPPIKLLDWFESKYGHGASDNKGSLVYETRRTREDSETMRTLPDVTEPKFVGRIVDRLLGHWSDSST